MNIDVRYPLDVAFRYEEFPLLLELKNIYDEDECKAFITLIEKNRPSIATNNSIYRDQDRVMIDDKKVADDLFERIKSALPTQIHEFSLKGLNERLRFYRYIKGQKFAPHMDHWYKASEQEISLFSVLVYFNGDFEGGETRFMEQLEQTIIPEPGKVAIFQHKIRHEGCEVLSGTKYAVRTDVMYVKNE